MSDTLRKRLQSERGFTLIELLVVIIILGILLAIAVPSYLSFRDKANDTAAQANIRSTRPAIEMWYADKATYVGATPAALRTGYDSAISNKIDITDQSATAYCIKSTGPGSTVWYFAGPGGEIVNTKPTGCT